MLITDYGFLRGFVRHQKWVKYLKYSTRHGIWKIVSHKYPQSNYWHLSSVTCQLVSIIIVFQSLRSIETSRLEVRYLLFNFRESFAPERKEEHIRVLSFCRHLEVVITKITIFISASSTRAEIRFHASPRRLSSFLRAIRHFFTLKRFERFFFLSCHVKHDVCVMHGNNKSNSCLLLLPNNL